MARREHPRYETTDWEDYEFREFPMMVYPGAKDQSKPYGSNGKPLKGIIVQNAAEAREALGLDEPEEGEKAPAPKKSATVPTGAKNVDRLRNEDDDKADALAEAEVLGLKVDKSWSVARIQDAIDTHKGENAQKDVV